MDHLDRDARPDVETVRASLDRRDVDRPHAARADRRREPERAERAPGERRRVGHARRPVARERPFEHTQRDELRAQRIRHVGVRADHGLGLDGLAAFEPLAAARDDLLGEIVGAHEGVLLRPRIFSAMAASARP